MSERLAEACSSARLTTFDCAGVVPAQIGSSFTFDVPASGSTISCDQVFSGESGNLAASGSRDLRGIREWHLFDSNGAALTKIRASDLFGQGPGYEGLSPYDTVGGEFLRVAYWTPDGKRTDGSPVSGDMGDARAAARSPFRAATSLRARTEASSRAAAKAGARRPSGPRS